MVWEHAYYVAGEQRFQLQAVAGSTSGNFGPIQTLSAISEAPLGADVAFNAHGRTLIVWSRYLSNDTAQVEGAFGP